MKILAVTNLYPTQANPSAGTFIEQQVKGLRAIGLDVDVMHHDRRASGFLGYWGLERRIAERIRACQPRIVHAMYGGVLGGCAATAAKEAGVPFCVSFCGSDLLGATERTLMTWARGRFTARGSRLAYQSAQRIIVKSRNLFDALPPDKQSIAEIIPNGIDLERFRPLDQDACRRELGWAPGLFHVLFSASSDTYRKRPELAQAAVDHVTARGVKATMHYLQNVPHRDVPKWFGAADALIVTSRQEGSMNVIKEALGCNLPIVSVDVGDARERLEGVVGCHLATPDPATLGEKLLEVHRHGRLPAGRAAVEALSLERVAERVMAVYHKIAGKSPELQPA